MSTVLIIALPILLIGVIISMGIGLATLAGNEEKDRRRSNRLMQWRVGLQGAAIVVLMAIIALAS